jgi:hypothetical protein
MPYFRETAQRISDALFESARSSAHFPENEQEFRKVMVSHGIDWDAIHDPWDRPYRIVPMVEAAYTDKITLRAYGQNVAASQTPVTRTTKAISIVSDGPDLTPTGPPAQHYLLWLGLHWSYRNHRSRPGRACHNGVTSTFSRTPACTRPRYAIPFEEQGPVNSRIPPGFRMTRPAAMCVDTLKLVESTMRTSPAFVSLYIFPGQEPHSLAQDKAEVGGAKAASPYPAV